MIKYTFFHNVGVCSFIAKWTKRRFAFTNENDYLSYRRDGYVLQSKYGQVIDPEIIRYREAQALPKQDII